MKLERPTYQKPLSLTGLGGGATSLSFASAGVPYVTDGLVCHYDFGDSSCYTHPSVNSKPLVNDLTGNSHTSKIYNGPGYDLDVQSTPPAVSYSSSNGGHLVFEPNYTPSGGSNSSNAPSIYRDTAPWTGLGNGDWAVEFWLDYYRYSLPSGQILQYIFQDGASYTGTLEIAINTSGKIYIYCFNQQMGAEPSTYYTISNAYNGWDHIVLSKIGSGSNNVKLYHKGVNTHSLSWNGMNYVAQWPGSAASGIWNSMAFFDSYNGRHFKGKFAIFRCYNGKGLDATEVLQNFNGERSRFGV